MRIHCTVIQSLLILPLTADALSTVCYLMGYEAANDLIDQLENVDALFITNDSEIHYTKEFSSIIPANTYFHLSDL